MSIPFPPIIGKMVVLATYLGHAGPDTAEATPNRGRSARDFGEEMRWLSENRHRFRGMWVAVLGNNLLASGPTAKEVYSKAANQPLPPLVVRVEDMDLPFAGW